MKLLLDTHIFIWALACPDLLSRKVAQTLDSEDSELWLSPIARLLSESHASRVQAQSAFVPSGAGYDG